MFMYSGFKHCNLFGFYELIYRSNTETYTFQSENYSNFLDELIYWSEITGTKT